ncbi:MAG: hypothetical protein ACKVX9_20880 [Blastocatellia bacterium]
MSKKRANREREKPAPAEGAEGRGRRKFLLAGLGGVGALAAAGLAGYQAGWFADKPPSAGPAPAGTPAYPNDMNAVAKSHLAPVRLPADAANATRAADDIVRHYARELMSPSALIHLVRSDGREVKLADGSMVVDHLCERYFAEKEVNGKKFLYVPREFEVHENSFLKTFLEAGVSLDQPIRVGGNRYTLRDFSESAKALFRYDPQNPNRFEPTLYTQHLPWGLIAFSLIVPASQPTWINAWGEKINLNEVIDGTLGSYELMCNGLHESLDRGEDESLEFRQQITKYSCYGMHSVYALFSCLRMGYRENRLEERIKEMYGLSIRRLIGDAKAIDREANAAKELGPEMLNRLAVAQDGKVVTRGAAPSDTIEVMRLRSQIRFLGHAFEALNYAEVHRLFTPAAEEKKQWRAGEQLLFDYLVALRATDLKPYWDWYSKFISNSVIAISHASRALKLLTPANPDKPAVKAA